MLNTVCANNKSKFLHAMALFHIAENNCFCIKLHVKYTTKTDFLFLLQGTSWSCPSPTLTPPFPLPPTEGEDPDPVEALLQLAANGRQSSLAGTSSSSSNSSTTTNVSTNPNNPPEQESDEGIVSDQSNEFEDKKVGF